MNRSYHNLCILADFVAVEVTHDEAAPYFDKHNGKTSALEAWAADNAADIETDANGNIIALRGLRVIDDPNCLNFYRFEL